METIVQNKTLEIFYKVIQRERTIEDLITQVKKDKSLHADRYAFQAFCCAMLAKESKSYLQKGKYIKQYASFITKSLKIDKDCIIARLIRYMIESKLEQVQFTSHQEEDLEFLKQTAQTVEDQNLKQLILNTIQNA